MMGHEKRAARNLVGVRAAYCHIAARNGDAGCIEGLRNRRCPNRGNSACARLCQALHHVKRPQQGSRTMSEAIETVIRQSGMIASRRLVLLALVELLPDESERRLSLHAICEAAGLPDRTIRRALADLVAGGVIMITEGDQEGRRNGIIRGWSRYRLLWGTLRRSLCRAREFVRERLEAAYAKYQEKMARRASYLVSRLAGKQRPATMAGVLSQDSFILNSATSWDISDAQIEAKHAENKRFFDRFVGLSDDEVNAELARMEAML